MACYSGSQELVDLAVELLVDSGVDGRVETLRDLSIDGLVDDLVDLAVGRSALELATKATEATLALVTLALVVVALVGVVVGTTLVVEEAWK